MEDPRGLAREREGSRKREEYITIPVINRELYYGFIDFWKQNKILFDLLLAHDVNLKIRIAEGGYGYQKILQVIYSYFKYEGGNREYYFSAKTGGMALVTLTDYRDTMYNIARLGEFSIVNELRVALILSVIKQMPIPPNPKILQSTLPIRALQDKLRVDRENFSKGLQGKI